MGELSVLGLGDLGEEGQQRLLDKERQLLAKASAGNLIVKVAHHGSKDQSAELMNFLRPDVAVFSVGENTYGHPTGSALQLANLASSQIVRTDLSGSLAFELRGSELRFSAAGKLTE